MQYFAGICGDVRGVSPLNSVGAHVRKLKAIPYSTIRSRVTAAIDQIRRQLTVKGIYRTLGEVSEDVDAGSTLGGSAEV